MATRIPDSPEAHEPRSDCVCETEAATPEGRPTSLRYELHVKLATRTPRSQVVIWCYDDGEAGVALTPAGTDVSRVARLEAKDVPSWTRQDASQR